jgi:hypothetical protein
LDPENGQRPKNQDKQQLRIGDRPAHEKNYPFIEEFSEFIASVPIASLKYKLMTQQQRSMVTPKNVRSALKKSTVQSGRP